MDIDKILESMPRGSRNALRDALNNYKRTHERRYAEEALAIFGKF